MANIISVITNIAIRIHGKKDAEMTSPIDFMPNFLGEEKEVKKQSIEEMKSVLMGLVSSQDRKVKQSGVKTRKRK